jgi:alanyl-tRNA synthetase
MADKSLNEIRNTFLDYFEKNDHRIVESSNLVPNNDPTLCLLIQEWYSLKMYLLV